MPGLNVGILGATGAVGRVILALLLKRNFPLQQLILMASEHSEGKKIHVAGEKFEVRAVRPDYFSGLDLVLFSPGSKVSKKYAPLAVERGAVVIDNSSAFRMGEGVPLVVPEINGHRLKEHSGIIANPNCSTIQMVLALNPIRKAYGLKRIIVTTFQSVSGSGQKGIEELHSQVRDYYACRDLVSKVYPHPIAFNLIPQIGEFLRNGFSEEEMKMLNETRKIYNQADLAVHATTVRVPVLNCHAESIYFETEREIEIDKLKSLYQQYKGLKFYPEADEYPVPLQVVDDPDVHVGRFKKDLTYTNAYSIWVVADNLWKGAALNAVQIAETLYEQGLI